MSTSISATFAALKAQNRMAFMPFITAGDPDLEMTLELVRELARRGVDLIEVGFPYSDPIADGPVVQASYTRALGRGLHVRDIFAAFRRLREESGIRGQGSGVRDQKSEVSAEHAQRTTDHGPRTTGTPVTSHQSPITSYPPLVAMVSYAIIFRMGPEVFVREAKEAGFAGLIVPDLPGDEAAELAGVTKAQGLDLVELIAPTTPPKRVARILAAASGFVYCISVAGTTGERTELPQPLREQLGWLRTQTDLSLAVGFGISRPEQVDALRGCADGVIVGSAIVRQLEGLSNGTASREDVVRSVGEFAGAMVAATRG